MSPPPGRRIVIGGTTGSGKTTLSRALGARLDLPVVELDALHWGPDWTPVPWEYFRERVAAAVAGDAWVVDGNYSVVRHLTWPRAETAVWLDYPPHVIARQLFLRTLRRGLRREELWSGNRERLWVHFLTRDSLFWWAIKSYRRRRRTYRALFADPAHAHLIRLHFRSPRDTNEWLATLPPG